MVHRPFAFNLLGALVVFVYHLSLLLCGGARSYKARVQYKWLLLRPLMLLETWNSLLALGTPV